VKKGDPAGKPGNSFASVSFKAAPRKLHQFIPAWYQPRKKTWIKVNTGLQC